MARRSKFTTPVFNTDQLRFHELLNGPKDSATIHFDEDVIPHGDCMDPLHCDCMCPHCWRKKVAIIRAVIPATLLAEEEKAV